ncbi:nuclease domain-containing protein [Acetobacterium wieringae]|uniref:nuclease domain-containing protein n=1 Tax=Acetobacterium wieringae TaxID=52694 RepID=UPI002B1FE2D6|nr:nuclease domain-containing protein [Acetobacterium wieringae]MEA4805807.1 nuclease domain-containing protein [Acetobacterium wieringae]
MPDGKPGPEEKIFYTGEISPEEKESAIAAFREFILDQVSDSDDDSRGFLKEYEDSQKQKKELNLKLKNKNERDKRWNDLEKKLDRIDETDLIKSVSKERTPIRSSNLFSFNPLYRRIYKIMKTNSGAMEGIDYYSTDEEFGVAKLPELYEKWCCIKLVMLFVDTYGFRIKGKNGEYGNDGVLGFKNLIKDILDERESLNGTKFELESDQISVQLNRPMHVSIWYDREFPIDKEELKENNVFAKYEHASLRPDIFMKIDYGNESRLFVFDAKYRGNQNYDGIKDLCEIAFQKYTKELARLKNPVSEFGINLPSEIISGSFILHSSTQTVADTKVVEGIELRDDSKKDLGNTPSKKSPDVELNYDAKKYLGDYPDKWSEKWIEKANDEKWNVNREKLKEWTTWKSGFDNNENKLGIITCNPKSNQLAYVIQMIMEQQFRLYQSKCWICGGEVEVSPKYTEKGQLKYHIKCKKCGKFMVETHCGKSECPSHDKKSKIGKHTENYYASAKSDNEDAYWNVSCPVCRQTAPNRKKQSFANCTVVACSAFLVE